MKYNYDEIMQIVHDILGDNATGLYTCEDIQTRDIGINDAPIFSNLEELFEVQSTDNFSVIRGLTKLCIIPKKKTNWIIKIPFTHMYSMEEVGEDEEEWFYKESGLVVEDYCDIEAANYLDTTSDIKSLFAEIFCIGDYNGIPIYIQERAKGMDKTMEGIYANGEALSHEIEYLWNMISFEEISDGFIRGVIFKLGLRTAIDAFVFINEIGDIHDENVGYRWDGSPIIFDYSGYNGRESYEWYEEVA